MIADTFTHGPYQVKIHKSPRAKRWAYWASLNDVRLEANWMSAQAAAAYAKQMIDRRLESACPALYVCRKGIAQMRVLWAQDPRLFHCPMIRTWKRQFKLGEPEIDFTDTYEVPEHQRCNLEEM